MAVTNFDVINGRLVGQSTNGVRTNFLTDALGSVTATVNTSAQVVNTYRHKPSGGILAKTGTGQDPNFLWNGENQSRHTGRLYAEQYNVARHYAPPPASWTTVDPLWPREAPYIYVKSNPTTYSDPLGLSLETAFIKRYCEGSGIECCTPQPPCADPGAPGTLPYFEKLRKHCAECAKSGGFKGVPAMCDELKSFDKRRPKFPSTSDLQCARDWRRSCIDYAYARCPTSGPLFDKCRHCMASCCIARACGPTVAEYVGWCRERQQLLDCVAGGYGQDDHDANVDGVRGAPKCRSACKKYGAF